MTLPPLANWTNTRDGLHRAAQVVGAVRAAVAEPEPNWVHLGLVPVSHGLTTGALPSVGELVLDFTALAILYHPPQKEPARFELAEHNQPSLADAVERGLAAAGHSVKLNREKLTSDAVIKIDPQQAADYAHVLYRLFETFKRFRASLPGVKTPAIVWPHGFDLSFLWFTTEQASEDAPHMAFGFSPGSGDPDRPYIYTYVYPVPDELTDHRLPPFTRWHTQGWTGTVTAYDDLAGRKSPETAVEETLRTLYDTLAPTLR